MDRGHGMIVADLMGIGISRARPHLGGFTSSRCWSVDLDDGRRVFVKTAFDEEGRRANRAETAVLASTQSPHLAALFAATDDGEVIITEDLSNASWRPRAATSGDQLVHGDLAPGNWSCTSDRLWKFVDWGSAYRGNPIADDATAAVRITRTRGRAYSSPRLKGHPEITAHVAGRFAAELLDVDWSSTPPAARRDRIADIYAGLTLVADLLGVLAPPRP